MFQLLLTRHVAVAGRRAYSTSGIPPLPPFEDWKKTIKHATVQLRDRVSVGNAETAAKLANAFIPEGLKDQVIIESFPGPGALTRAFLDLPRERVRKIILLEDAETYLEHLRPLQQDPRVVIIPKSAATWTTFHHLKEDKLLEDTPPSAWDAGLHPHLHFVSHIPHTTMGEQLVAQWCRCIPDHSWIFTNGRVPMHLIMGEWLWQRTSAGPLDPARCKVSVIAEAVAESKYALPGDDLQPYENHFHPPGSGATSTKRTDNRKKGAAMSALTITPRADCFIPKGQLDEWDFVLRRLFVKKGTSLEKAIFNLAPAAQDLLDRIRAMEIPGEYQLDTTRQIRHMTVQDWAIVCQAFHDWPFAPQDLMISGSFNRDDV